MIIPKIRVIKTDDGFFAVSPYRWDVEEQKNRYITDDECALDAINSKSAHIIEILETQEEANIFSKEVATPINKFFAGPWAREVSQMSLEEQQQVQDYSSGMLPPVRIETEDDFNRYKNNIPTTVQNYLIKTGFKNPIALYNPTDNTAMDIHHGKMNYSSSLATQDTEYFTGAIPSVHMRAAGNYDKETGQYEKRAGVARYMTHGDMVLQLFRHMHGFTYKGKYDATNSRVQWRDNFAEGTNTLEYLSKANGYIKKVEDILNKTNSTWAQSWEPYNNNKTHPTTKQELLNTVLGIHLMEIGYDGLEDDDRARADAHLKRIYSTLQPMMNDYDTLLKRYGYEHGYIDYLQDTSSKRDELHDKVKEKLKSDTWRLNRPNGGALGFVRDSFNSIQNPNDDRIRTQIEKDNGINIDNLLRQTQGKPTKEQADITLTTYPPEGD